MSIVHLGHMSYLNGLLSRHGFYHPLCQSFCGVPSVLNHKLKAGELDLAWVSSYEALKEGYTFDPDLCIGSFGDSQSVLVFTQLPPESWSGISFYLTSQSATSAQLCRILAQNIYGVSPKFEAGSPQQEIQPEELLKKHKAVLLIGDQALSLRFSHPSFYDLGDLWRKATGLGFAFGLFAWKSSFKHKAQPEIREVMKQNLALNLKRLAELYPQAKTALDFPAFQEYFSRLQFFMTPEIRAGLELFRKYQTH